MPGVADWTVHRWVSHLHWAAALNGGQLQNLAAADASMVDAASRLGRAVSGGPSSDPASGVIGRRWNAMIGVAAGCSEISCLVDAFFSCGLVEREPLTNDRQTLAAALTRFLDRADSVAPQADAELLLRIRPLREAWEARGPGLMKHVAGCLTNDQIEPPAILPVLPVSGGGGGDHFPLPTVRIEAVLANPNPLLPEVLRIAWLLTVWETRRQLVATATPADEASIHLAAVGPVLEAAEHVQLAAFDEPHLAAALENWCRLDQTRVDLAGLIRRWQTGEPAASWTDRVRSFRDDGRG